LGIACVPIVASIAFTGLFVSRPISPILDKSYAVGEYRVRERISPVGGNWPDQKYERVYTLEHDGQLIEIGRFKNEDRTGIQAAEPKLVGDWLVIFSASRTFIWKPNTEPIAFVPFDAVNWGEVEKRHHGINSSYDYEAIDLTIDGDRWAIEYRCFQGKCLHQARPNKITFISEDEGQTFYAINEELS